MTTTDWQRFFDRHAPDYMGNPFVGGTLAEADFLVEHLALAPGARVLDLGCGTGRHAVELAKRGMKVTGVDLSAGMLTEAAKAAAAAGVSVTWVNSTAQDYRSEAPFDAVYSVCEGGLCLFNEGDPPDRDLAIFRVLFDALRPGGRALITVLNAMRFIRQYTPEDVAAGRFDPLSLVEHAELTVDSPDGPLTTPTHEKGYVPTELRLMLQLAGFDDIHITGGTAGNWRLTAPDLDEMELLARMVRPA